MKDIDKMEGRVFEYFLEKVFKEHGYKVKVTDASGDFGADLILAKDKVKTVVQAKRRNNKVGPGAVQEVRAAIDYYKAARGWVVTNSYYTDAAKKLAKANNIKLIDRVGLAHLILEMNAEEIPEVSMFDEKVIEEKMCPQCSKELVLRKSKRGYFYGCSSYPGCTYTESYDRESLSVN